VGVGAGIRSFKRDYRTTSLAIIFIVLLISLGQRIPLVANISHTLKELPIISQAFRAAFTKVSVPFVLMIAVLAGTTLTQFLTSMQHKMRKMTPSIFGVVLVVTLSWGAPLFAGHLFSDQVKQTLPAEYSEVFAFFKQQPATERIAVLPLIEHWGWHYYDWEYIGSGFLWYGIEQPILDRSFDSWSKNNETFYAQLYAASENQDEQSVLTVLQQYQVSWLFLDSHLTKSSGDRVQDEIDFLTALFVKNNFEAHSFGGITLYKNPLATNIAPNKPIAEAFGVTTYTTQNSISRSLGSYISGSSYIFPFSQLTSTHGLELTNTTDNYEVPGSLETVEKNKNYELRLPALNEKILASASVSLTDSEIGVVTTTKIPLIEVDQQVFDVNNSKINVFPLEELEPAEEYYLTIGSTVQTIRSSDTQKTEVLTSLDPNRNLPLQLFSASSTEVVNLSKAVKWASLSDCFAPESSGKKYGTQTGTTIVTTGDSACFSAQVGQLTANEELPELYSLTFKYKLDQGALEHLCLTRAEDKQKVCYSGELANLEQPGQEKEAVATFQLYQAGTYWLDFRVGAHTQFTIENISLQIHEILFSAHIPAENWVALQNEQVVPLKSAPKNVAILLPKEEKYSFALSEITSIANCDVFNRGEITLEKNDKLLSITAKNGAVACLPITLADLDISNIIAVQSVQNSGKSPEFTVSDLSANKVAFEVSPVGSFTAGISRVRSQANRQTDQLTTTVRSYTNTSSASSLESLFVIPVPLEWFSQLHLVAENPLALSFDQIVTSSTNNWYAQTKLNADTNSLVVLDQSAHPAWIAFPSNRPWQLLDHRTYNGWANGWIVPAGTTTVTMLFWPQLLSFFGYGVLIITFGWLSIAALRQGKAPQNTVVSHTTASHELHHFVLQHFKKLRKLLLGK
jgi:hypothetical protein